MYYGFAYDNYYPLGGVHDMRHFGEDLYEVTQHMLTEYQSYDYIEVYVTDDVEGLKLEWSNHRAV